MTKNENQKTAIQLCHGYKMPFFDVAQQYSDTLRKSGYYVITIFLTGPEDDKIKTKSIADETIFFELTSKKLKGLKFGLLKRFNAICSENNADLIIAHRAKAIYLSCISAPFRHKAMIIGVAHAYDVFKRKNRKLLAYSSRKQLRLVGVSNAIRDNIRESLPFFPKEHIQTFYNRFDFDNSTSKLFTREDAREKLGINKDVHALINIGRLHPDKDQKTLISGYTIAHIHLNKVQESHLYLIGSGKLENTLKLQIDALNANSFISLLGVIPEAWKYLRAFDGFILSSDHEPFGMVLLEAIAAQLPIISSDTGGAPEINQSSLTFRTGDQSHLSKLIIDLSNASIESKKEALYINKKHAEENFSFTYAKRDFEKLINQLSH